MFGAANPCPSFASRARGAAHFVLFSDRGPDWMFKILRTCLACAAVAVVLAPATARADGYLTPWAGVTFANETDAGDRAFGVTTGYMGGGVFGFEADIGYSPDFFGS